MTVLERCLLGVGRAPGGNVPGGLVGRTDVSAGQVGGLPGFFIAFFQEAGLLI